MPLRDLTVDQIVELGKAVFANGESLVKESLLLAGSGFHARAYTLAHLACEELAKLPTLLRLGIQIASHEPVDWKRVENSLLKHQEKLRAGTAVDYILDIDQIDDRDIRRYVDAVENVPAANDLKNDSL